MDEFLCEKGVEFITRNVAEDEEAFSKLEKIGTMTTPVAVMSSDKVVVGFDRKKLEQLLEI
jgi:glutaredoxin